MRSPGSEGLAERIAVDGVLVDGGDERHLFAVVGQLAVGLVGDDVDAVAVFGRFFLQQLRQLRDAPAGEDDAGGVVRGVQEDDGGLLADGSGEGVQIDLEILRARGHGRERAARGLGVELVLREIWAERQHLVAGREQRIGQHRQRRGCAGGHVHILRAVADAERLLEIRRHLRADGRKARRGRIGVQLLGRDGLQQALDRLPDAGRRRDGRVADGKVEHVFRADDGGALLAVGGEIPDDAALAAPGDHFFTDHIAYSFT